MRQNDWSKGATELQWQKFPSFADVPTWEFPSFAVELYNYYNGNSRHSQLSRYTNEMTQNVFCVPWLSKGHTFSFTVRLIWCGDIFFLFFFFVIFCFVFLHQWSGFVELNWMQYFKRGAFTSYPNGSLTEYRFLVLHLVLHWVQISIIDVILIHLFTPITVLDLLFL